MKSKFLTKIKYLSLLVLTSAFLASCGDDPKPNNGGNQNPTKDPAKDPANPAAKPDSYNFALSLKDADGSALAEGVIVLAVDKSSKKEFVAKTDGAGVANFYLPNGTYKLSANNYILGDKEKNSVKVKGPKPTYSWLTQTYTSEPIKGFAQTEAQQLEQIISSLASSVKEKAESYVPSAKGFSAILQDKAGKKLANIPVRLLASDASFDTTFTTNANGEVVFPSTDEPLLSSGVKGKLSIQIAGDGEYWFDGTTLVKDATKALELTSNDAGKTIKIPANLDLKVLSLYVKDKNKSGKPISEVTLTKVAVAEIPAKDKQPKVEAIPASDWSYTLTNGASELSFLVVKGDYKIQTKSFADNTAKTPKYYGANDILEADANKAKQIDLKTADQAVKLVCEDCISNSTPKFASRKIKISLKDSAETALKSGVLSLIDKDKNIKFFAVGEDGNVNLDLKAGTYNLAYDTYFLEKNSKKTELEITNEEASFSKKPSKRTDELSVSLDTSKAFKVKFDNKTLTNTPLSYIAVSLISQDLEDMKFTGIADKNGLVTFYETDKILFLKDGKYKIKLNLLDSKKSLWVKTTTITNTTPNPVAGQPDIVTTTEKNILTDKEADATAFVLENKEITVEVETANTGKAVASLPIEFKNKAGELRLVKDFVIYDVDSNDLNKVNLQQTSDALVGKYGVLVYADTSAEKPKKFAVKQDKGFTSKNYYVEETDFKGFKEVDPEKAKVFEIKDKTPPTLQVLEIADDVNPIDADIFTTLKTKRDVKLTFTDKSGSSSALDQEGFLLVNYKDETKRYKISTKSGVKTLEDLPNGQYYVVAKNHYVGEKVFVDSSSKAKLYTIYSKTPATGLDIKIPLNTAEGMDFTVKTSGTYGEGISDILVKVVNATSNTVEATYKTNSSGVAKIYSSQDFFIDKTTKYRIKVELVDLSKDAPVEYWYANNSFDITEANAEKITLTSDITAKFASGVLGKQIYLDFSKLKQYPSEISLSRNDGGTAKTSLFKLPISTDKIRILTTSASPNDDGYWLSMPVYKEDGTSEVKYYKQNSTNAENGGWVSNLLSGTSLTFGNLLATNATELTCGTGSNSCGNPPSLTLKVIGTVLIKGIITTPATNVPFGATEFKITVTDKEGKALPNIGVYLKNSNSSYSFDAEKSRFAKTNAEGIAEFTQQNAYSGYTNYAYILGDSKSFSYSSEEQTIKLDFKATEVPILKLKSSSYSNDTYDNVVVNLHKLGADGEIDSSFNYQAIADDKGYVAFYPNSKLTIDKDTQYRVSLNVAGDGTYWLDTSLEKFSKDAKIKDSGKIKLSTEDASGNKTATKLTASIPSSVSGYYNTSIKSQLVVGTDDKYNPKPIQGLAIGVATADTDTTTSQIKYAVSPKFNEYEFAPVNYTDKIRVLALADSDNYYYKTLPKTSSSSARYFLNGSKLQDDIIARTISVNSAIKLNCESDSCYNATATTKGTLELTVKQKSGSGFPTLKIVAISKDNPNQQYQAVTTSTGVATFSDLKMGSAYQFYALGNFLTSTGAYVSKYSSLKDIDSVFLTRNGGSSTVQGSVQTRADYDETSYISVARSSGGSYMKNVPVAMHYNPNLWYSNTGPSGQARFYTEIPGLSNAPLNESVEAMLEVVGQHSTRSGNMFRETGGATTAYPGAFGSNKANNFDGKGTYMSGYVGSSRDMVNIEFVDAAGNPTTPYSIRVNTPGSNYSYFSSYLNTGFNLPVPSSATTLEIGIQARKEDNAYNTYLKANLTSSLEKTEASQDGAHQSNYIQVVSGQRTVTIKCPRCNPAPVKD